MPSPSEIAPIRLDSIGVGQYDAPQTRIGLKIILRRSSARSGNVRRADLRCAGSWLVYPNVNNLPADATVTFRVAAGNPTGSTIEIHEGNPQGRFCWAFARSPASAAGLVEV